MRTLIKVRERVDNLKDLKKLIAEAEKHGCRDGDWIEIHQDFGRLRIEFEP